MITLLWPDILSRSGDIILDGMEGSQRNTLSLAAPEPQGRVVEGLATVHRESTVTHWQSGHIPVVGIPKSGRNPLHN